MPRILIKSNFPSKKAANIFIFLLGFSVFLPTVLGVLFLFSSLIILINLSWKNNERMVPISLAWWALLGLLISWPLLTAWINGPLPEMWERWLHVLRVCLFVAFALKLPVCYKRFMWFGLLVGAFYMVTVVMVHQWIYPLPDWAIWRDLLTVRGNSSSKLWIALAATAACLLWAALYSFLTPSVRVAALTGWMALSLVVAIYSISRNAHLLIVVLPAVVLIYKLGVTARGLALAFASLGLAVALSLQIPSVENRIEQAFLEMQNYKEKNNFQGSASVRWKMYSIASENMLRHPVVGTGLGSWQTRWAEASRNYPTTSGINNPHNDFLLFGMETGVPGVLLLILIFVLIMKEAYKNRSFEGGLGWVFAWTLLITCTVNAPFRDATIGMSLIIFAVTFSVRAKSSDS